MDVDPGEPEESESESDIQIPLAGTTTILHTVTHSLTLELQSCIQYNYYLHFLTQELYLFKAFLNYFNICRFFTTMLCLQSTSNKCTEVPAM